MKQERWYKEIGDCGMRRQSKTLDLEGTLKHMRWTEVMAQVCVYGDIQIFKKSGQEFRGPLKGIEGYETEVRLEFVWLASRASSRHAWIACESRCMHVPRGKVHPGCADDGCIIFNDEFRKFRLLLKHEGQLDPEAVRHLRYDEARGIWVADSNYKATKGGRHA